VDASRTVLSNVEAVSADDGVGALPINRGLTPAQHRVMSTGTRRSDRRRPTPFPGLQLLSVVFRWYGCGQTVS